MGEKEETVDGFEINFSDPGISQSSRRSSIHSIWEKKAKRAIDVVVALLFLVSHGLIYLGIWLCVRYTTGTPAIYRHRRVGLEGKDFDCLKFRSMVVNSAEVLQHHLAKNPELQIEWERDFKLRDDPRVTKFGRFIRKTSLDELPQFWNVLRGEMSLVGPRPVVDSELKQFYGAKAKYYMSVKPGITGPWQVGGRNDLGYGERVKLDADYALNWTVVGDLVILAKTAIVVLTRRGSY